MDVCNRCGAKAEATTEKVWQSYLIEYCYDGAICFTPNPELDEETVEVHYWCLKCMRESESWD